MFVRKKKNRSGSTSIVVVDKSRGRFRELKTIGVSSTDNTISELYREGKRWIASQTGERDMRLSQKSFFERNYKFSSTLSLCNTESGVRLNL